MRRQVPFVVLCMLLHPLMSLASQQSDIDISSLSPRARQAHTTLLKASLFSIGPVGYDAQLSEAEVALGRLLEEKEAIAVLTDLLTHATVEGKMYALWGLRVKDRELFKQAVQPFKAEEEGEKMVGTQSGCIVMPSDVKTVLTKIELGLYDSLYKASPGRN